MAQNKCASKTNKYLKRTTLQDNLFFNHEKKTKEKSGERPTKATPNNLENGNRNIYINNYFKCQWIKCSNQKTQTG